MAPGFSVITFSQNDSTDTLLILKYKDWKEQKLRTNLSYSIWKKDNVDILNNLIGKKIILSYSGGKDSSVTLFLMQKAAKEFGFDFETHAAVYPQHVYSKKDMKALNAYWHERDMRVEWHDVPATDAHLTKALEEGVSPCWVCGQMKKKILVSHLKDKISDWESLVIIMSYSLWDLVSATIEHISSAIFTDDKSYSSLKGKTSEERFIETSQRFYPILNLKGGLTIYKPLIKYNDQDIFNFIAENRIPVTTTECKYRDFRPKRLLSNYYEKMELYFNYDNVLGFVKDTLNIPRMSYYEKRDLKEYLTSII